MHTVLLLFPLKEAKSDGHGHTACTWADLQLTLRPDSYGRFLETILTSPYHSLSPRPLLHLKSYENVQQDRARGAAGIVRTLSKSAVMEGLSKKEKDSWTWRTAW